MYLNVINIFFSLHDERYADVSNTMYDKNDAEI